MNIHRRNAALIGAVFAAVAASASAQSNMPSAASAPAAVGVTPQAAAEANARAVPRSDTATVVRTGPDAQNRLRAARGANDAGSAPVGSAMTDQVTRRPARADRN